MDQVIHKVLEPLPSGWIQYERKPSCSPDRSHVILLQLRWRSSVGFDFNAHKMTIDAGQNVRDPGLGEFIGKKLNLPASH